MITCIVYLGYGRELQRGTVEAVTMPIGAMYLYAWLKMCRLDTDIHFIDERHLVIAGEKRPVFGSHHEVVIYWVRPGTVEAAIESAAATRELAAGNKEDCPYLVACGPGTYGWPKWKRSVFPFHLVIEEAPYGIIEAILRGEHMQGSLAGGRFSPPVRLPSEAGQYKIGRIVTMWGAPNATTFCVLPLMQQFDFRNTPRVCAEIKMLGDSEATKCIEVADAGLFAHPGVHEIMTALQATGKPWGAVIDCRRNYGERSRMIEAASAGMSLLTLDVMTRNQKTLTGISRNVTRKEIERTFKYALELRSSGIEILIRLLYGLPHQTYEGLLDDMAYFSGHYNVALELRRLRVQPGTWLWHHRKMSGLILNEQTHEVVSTRWMTPAEMLNLELVALSNNASLNIVGHRQAVL